METDNRFCPHCHADLWAAGVKTCSIFSVAWVCFACSELERRAPSADATWKAELAHYQQSGKGDYPGYPMVEADRQHIAAGIAARKEPVHGQAAD